MKLVPELDPTFTPGAEQLARDVRKLARGGSGVPLRVWIGSPDTLEQLRIRGFEWKTILGPERRRSFAAQRRHTPTLRREYQLIEIVAAPPEREGEPT